MPEPRLAPDQTKQDQVLFRATTLFPIGSDALVPASARRSRILTQLNRHPVTNSINSIIGPPGSGKTTVALQWALEQSGPTQWIAARSRNDLPTDLPDELFGPPSPFGQALADLLNGFAFHEGVPDVTDLEALFGRLVALSMQERNLVIVDDLELIGPGDADQSHEGFQQALGALQMEQVLLVSRIIAPNGFDTLRTLGNLRVVLPSTLEFDAREATEAHRLGVFGDASLDQVLAARNETRGWIAGMLTLLENHGGQTITRESFQNIILNDLLLLQTPAVTNLILASALVPVNTHYLWEQWFDHLGMSKAYIPTIIAQLPTYQLYRDDQGFAIVPVMKECLQNLSRITGDAPVIEDLLTIAIDWYVENRDLDIAIDLATNQNLEQQLTRALNPALSEFAASENWPAIQRVVHTLPQELLLKDHDITYWTMLGLEEAGEWTTLTHLQNRVLRDWLKSSNPLVAGRAQLIQAWNAYTLSKGEEALAASILAYETLPEHAERDRLWAAGWAVLAQAMLGNSAEARRWSALANFLYSSLPWSSRWWHRNAGMLRFSWLAIAGMLDESYEYIERQVRAHRGSSNIDVVGYLHIMAQIQIERGNFDSARSLLDEVSGRASVQPTHQLQHFQRMILATLARAKGDLASAWEILAQVETSVNQRFDLFARETVTRASVALEAGDVSAADLYLASVPDLMNIRPTFFGDQHPALVKAQTLSAQGEIDQAIDISNAVLEDTQARNRMYYIVAAHATQAFIYHGAGDYAARDRAIDAAVAVAPDSGFQGVFNICGTDVRSLRSVTGTPTRAASPEVSTSRPPDELLTTRELEVLTLAAKSLSNKEIASKMFISVSTVKNHLAKVYDKLGANTRRGAVSVATSLGLLEK